MCDTAGAFPWSVLDRSVMKLVLGAWVRFGVPLLCLWNRWGAWRRWMEFHGKSLDIPWFGNECWGYTSTWGYALANDEAQALHKSVTCAQQFVQWVLDLGWLLWASGLSSWTTYLALLYILRWYKPLEIRSQPLRLREFLVSSSLSISVCCFTAFCLGLCGMHVLSLMLLIQVLFSTGSEVALAFRSPNTNSLKFFYQHRVMIGTCVLSAWNYSFLVVLLVFADWNLSLTPQRNVHQSVLHHAGLCEIINMIGTNLEDRYPIPLDLWSMRIISLLQVIALLANIAPITNVQCAFVGFLIKLNLSISIWNDEIRSSIRSLDEEPI